MLYHTGTRTLETERLILRPFKRRDAKAMFTNWASDPTVTRYLQWRSHESVHHTKKVIAAWLREYRDIRNYHWAIVLKETGEAIGSITMVSVNDRDRNGTIGYVIGARWWNRGIVSEAMNAVLRHMFKTVRLERIDAYHHVDNPASGRVMQKGGMAYEGTCRKMIANADGILVDCERYAILSGEFQ